MVWVGTIPDHEHEVRTRVCRTTNTAVIRFTITGFPLSFDHSSLFNSPVTAKCANGKSSLKDGGGGVYDIDVALTIV